MFCFLWKALSALSTQAANLSSKLEAALKQQEQFFKKTLKQHSAKVSKVHHLVCLLPVVTLDGSLIALPQPN
jgi:hypothetical protein